MKTGAIVFSRYNSNRLNGKVFKLINGKSLLDRVIESLSKVKNIDHICIATTLNTEDDKIEKFAKELKIDVYRGSESDLIDRSIQASKKFKYSNFLRVCGDRPFIDTDLYEELIYEHLQYSPDITTNTFPRSVPFGFSGEVVKVNSLIEIQGFNLDKYYEEHITSFFMKTLKNLKYVQLTIWINIRSIVK